MPIQLSTLIGLLLVVGGAILQQAIASRNEA